MYTLDSRVPVQAPSSRRNALHRSAGALIISCVAVAISIETSSNVGEPTEDRGVRSSAVDERAASAYLFESCTAVSSSARAASSASAVTNDPSMRVPARSRDDALDERAALQHRVSDDVT
jgi:hypothetical protein